MAKILLVEDEPMLSEPIRVYLAHEHHVVEVVDNGREALERLRFYDYDVVILDWMLPEMEGIDVCRSYRAAGGSTPILMLTARNKVEEKIDALDAGADDYLTKPFEVAEVAARVRALLRRPAKVAASVLKIRNIVLDPAKFSVTRDGDDVQLLPKEFAFLEFLMRHPNQVFSADTLLDRVWSSDSEASPETIRTYVKRLRKKLDSEGAPSIIATIHGVGYRLDP